MNPTKKHHAAFSKDSATLYHNRAETVQAETLFCDHQEKIKAFLLSRGQSGEMIEEILQDLYLKLMALDDLSVIKNPASYLLRIAHNLMIDTLRRQNRADSRATGEEVETLNLVDPSPSPFDEILSIQQLQCCERALAELPPECKEILLLNRMEGLTHCQIAKRYGRSASWVEKIIVRTLSHCRRRLEQFAAQ